MTEQRKPLWEECAEVCAFNKQNPGWPDLDSSDWALIFRIIADEVIPRPNLYDGKDDVQRGIWMAERQIRARLLEAVDEAEGGNG